MKRIPLLLFSSIMFWGGYRQATKPESYLEQAKKAGIPASREVISASGWAMIGATVGLQVGFLRRICAFLLAIELPVVTWVGHRFWEFEPGPPRNQQRTHFLKNLSLIGAALYIAFG